MATNSSSSTSDIIISSSSSSHQMETSHLPITTHKLNGQNYLQWSQSILMFIRGKEKDDYIIGASAAPKTTTSTYKKWIAENNMVMSWLVNSMTTDIGENFLSFDTAKEIWDIAKETFSDKENTSEIIQIEGILHDLRQGNLTVTEYFNTLTRLWHQLDTFEVHNWNCVTDGLLYKKIVEGKRVFKFLLGLNKNLDEIKGRIMGVKPLPSLREAFSEVRREESRKNLMMGSHQQLNMAESSALKTQFAPFDNRQKIKGGRPWCDHCRKPRHSRETCWKIHGKPVDWKPRQPPEKEGRGNHVATNEQSPQPEASPFNKKQMEMLQKLLSHLLSVQSQTGSSSNQVIGSGTLAHKGNFLSAFTTGKKSKKPWIVDSGASDHMTGDATIFDTNSSCPNNLTVRIADGSLSKVAGTGSVVLSRDLTLNFVLLVPNLDCNLLSISKRKRGDLDSGKTIGNAEECSGLYILKECHDPQEQPQMAVGSNSFSVSCQNNDSAIMLWHYRLGHPNVKYLKHLFPSLFNKNPKSFECEICQLSKQVRSHFPIQPYKESSPFSMIHSDIWGPSRIKNVTGTRWLVSFIDVHTRLTWVFLMKEKSETSQIFKNFKNMIQTQFQSKIQILKSDNARDYFNSIIGEFLAQEGIVHLSSCVDTPQQNGIAERKNRHLLEVARSLMFSMNVPKLFWGQAVLTAAYLINRMPSRVLKFQTPCQTLLKSFPTTRFISTIPPKIFGCSVFVHINQQHRSKLDPRSLKCIFLGYSSNQKGYKCYSPVTRKFYNLMDVTFFETQPYYPKNDIQGENSTQEYQFWDLESFNESPITTENHIPPESFNQPESIVDLWDKEHIQEEMEEEALSQQTHEAEPGPNPSKLPGNNAPDGTVDSELENDILNMPIAWRKGVRSCTQHPIGNFISYDKLSPTFRAFTSSITEIPVPRNIQEAFKYPKWKAVVDEEVRALEKNGTWEITDLPRGKKPIRCKWIFTIKYKADGNVDRYKARLVAKGFTQSYGIDYQETFAPVAKLNTVRVLLSLAANLDWSLHQLDVKNAFLNGDLEEEVYMDIPAGLETTSNFNKVCRLRKSLYGLKQSPRAWFERFTKVVKGYGFVQCQSDHTLFVKHFPEGKLTIIIVYVDDIILTGDHEEKIDLLKKLLTKEFEIKDLGNLKYFLGMEIARSKKGIAVSQCKYVLDLLNETGMLGCKPAETPMNTTVKLEESDGSAPVDEGRYQRLVGKLIYLSHTRLDIGFSVSVAIVHLSGGNLVTWRSKKQSVVARSSAEAEFRAMAQGICEGIWLNRLLEELRVPLKHPMVLYCDNQAAISIAKNPVHHDRTKHMEIDRHFIKEKIEEGVFKVSYTPTNCQTTDILTKALARVNFEDLTEKLGMINIYNAA
uniref:Integrase catalytic domain-containing protein n=1 Tax=Vitis vinifera TaxID=29760 RepID=A5AZT5_VITVI|nr:hypothetical protein VITISV_011639 [Vitis vinifera]